MTDDTNYLRSELDAGEELLWTGKPSPGVAAGRSVGQAVAGAVLLCFALFWMSMTSSISRPTFPNTPPNVIIHTDPPGENIPLPPGFLPDSPAPAPSFGPPGASLFPLFGLIFVAAGLYMMASPSLNATNASRALCAITDRRAIIHGGGNTYRAARVQSFYPRDLERIERRDHDNDSGDVVFARRVRRGHKGRTYEEEIGFFGVPHVREAEKFLRQLAAQVIDR